MSVARPNHTGRKRRRGFKQVNTEVRKTRRAPGADALAIPILPAVTTKPAGIQTCRRIQQLIREDSAPRQLVVVTGDQQIQRVARRRRATVVDSEQWRADLLSRRRTQRSTSSARAEKPQDPMSDLKVESWLEFFGENAG